jgi:MarR family transcriptional regulator, organic hydroperoxide resistance regulator
MHIVDDVNYWESQVVFASMKSTKSQACEAWQLLLKLFFNQRAGLPAMASNFELSPAQCHVLHLIEPDQPIPMGKLAEALACDASNVTGLVDRLESRGLVRRKPSAGDRRVKVLELTAAGARLRSTVLEQMTKPPESLSRLSAGEQRALVKILRRLLD